MNPEGRDLTRADISFDVDGMLGRLAKWLRILGFDADFPCPSPSEGRLFVTMKKAARFSSAITITATDLESQLEELFEQTKILPDPDLFLSRCLVCNIPVTEIPKESVSGKVPRPVFEMISVFNECPRCRRIYWEGSHGTRIKSRLEKIRTGASPRR